MSAIASAVPRDSATTQALSLPCMHEEELRLFWQSIPKGGVCLEFGMGGSTHCFFARGATALYSVEGDRHYMETVCADPLLKAKNAARRFFPMHAYIGPVKEWSYPVESPTPFWLNYHHRIWEAIPAASLDFVLIDGRFRVACALQCFLRCRPDAIYLIHDFTTRPHYAHILQHAEVLARAGSSVLLKRRVRPDYQKMALDLLDAQFIPA